MSNQRNSDERIIGLDIPLEGKGRTKRLYIHIADDRVRFRYHPTKERRFTPYRTALKRLEEMVDDDKMSRMRAEGTSYDKSIPPLLLDLS